MTEHLLPFGSSVNHYLYILKDTGSTANISRRLGFPAFLLVFNFPYQTAYPADRSGEQTSGNRSGGNGTEGEGIRRG